MSTKELSRIAIFEKLTRREITQAQPADQLSLSVRQVRRLQKQFVQDGPQALRSKKRGRVSNNKLLSYEVERIAKLVCTHYADFGPTLAHEKLTQHHSATLSVESLRSIMINRCQWIPKGRKRREVHQSRKRRARFGELVQIDGSPHAWLEKRGPECCLIVYIDDATGAFLGLKLFPSETTQAYMEMTKAYLEDYGRPAAYYSDRHLVFKSPKEGGDDTQFGRALKALDIEIICAHSPQAKGRVERANQTIELTLCDRETRIVSKALEISYKNKKLQLSKNRHRLKGAKITVCDLYGDGPLVLLYEGKEITYTQFEQNTPPSIETDKTVNAKVDSIIRMRKKSTWKPASNHPWRLSASQEVVRKEICY